MSSNTTILITGANRGIGKGLVAVYLAVPNTTVVATVRDPSHPTAESLQSLPKATGSSLIVIKLDVSSTESINSGIKSLGSTHDVHGLDVVIANAGIAGMSDPLTLTPVSELQKFINVNAYGPLELFQAVASLLRSSKADNKGKFVLISSAGGSLTTMNTILPLAGYGASKALANFLFKWLALESEDVLIWAQHPGMVASDMGTAGFDAAKEIGIDLSAHAISVEESAQAIKQIVDRSTFENIRGKFIGPDGSELPW
ncbi:hypothetical protein TRIATDRAFT_82704 [Trichoderma atroviride IMI 206040]|uniref:Aflatoxin biosynthesis ketoreductase nor-1 n=2 Tax=Hypocrea atroviridis TaxID=63577 RepID=G9NHW2_HYPAI|nr:uncharacterized protein TRIATDRAFT_82704 [Trichoderma atroviride IMI 206040]EHK49381.1 hypothetical protein TRIATDRAFT_82704 [Trichoderma atroviride IMI 206040]